MCSHGQNRLCGVRWRPLRNQNQHNSLVDISWQANAISRHKSLIKREKWRQRNELFISKNSFYLKDWLLFWNYVFTAFFSSFFKMSFYETLKQIKVVHCKIKSNKPYLVLWIKKKKKSTSLRLTSLENRFKYFSRYTPCLSPSISTPDFFKLTQKSPHSVRYSIMSQNSGNDSSLVYMHFDKRQTDIKSGQIMQGVLYVTCWTSFLF